MRFGSRYEHSCSLVGCGRQGPVGELGEVCPGPPESFAADHFEIAGGNHIVSGNCMVVVKFARQNVKEQWLSFGTGIDVLNKKEQGELKDSLDCLQK